MRFCTQNKKGTHSFATDMFSRLKKSAKATVKEAPFLVVFTRWYHSGQLHIRPFQAAFSSLLTSVTAQLHTAPNSTCGSAGRAGRVCAPVHHHVQHAPQACRLPLRHHSGLCIRWSRLPTLLPVPPGHPHPEHHGGPQMLASGADARLDWHGKCPSYHLWRCVPTATRNA